jgi:diguanylate cyclase (GGDEF)-like protein
MLGNDAWEPGIDPGRPVRVLLIGSDGRAATWIDGMVRAAWRGALVVARAEQLGDAILELRSQGAACVMLDASPLEGHWVWAVEQIRTAAPDVAIVVICDKDDEHQALAALNTGAQDCLTKGELSPARLCRSVRFAIQRKRFEARIAHDALHDPLTGLPNRTLFLDRLRVALDRARRSGATTAVLFLDVDDFKQVNDRLGHHAGDLLLVGLAKRLEATLRPMDTVARFGGDEFIFLLEELAGEREVVAIAQRISDATARAIPLGEDQVTVTVSIGIAIVSGAASTPQSVIQQADAAMYRAKEHGRARFELFG